LALHEDALREAVRFSTIRSCPDYVEIFAGASGHGAPPHLRALADRVRALLAGHAAAAAGTFSIEDERGQMTFNLEDVLSAAGQRTVVVVISPLDAPPERRSFDGMNVIALLPAHDDDELHRSRRLAESLIPRRLVREYACVGALGERLHDDVDGALIEARAEAGVITTWFGDDAEAYDYAVNHAFGRETEVLLAFTQDPAAARAELEGAAEPEVTLAFE
jgi:hypothetical protein